jgi:hypothetical protein
LSAAQSLFEFLKVLVDAEPFDRIERAASPPKISGMTKHEKIAALLKMTVDRGCTAAEAETARRLVAKLQAERAPTETIVRRFDPPVTLDRHRSRGSRTTRGYR